jgi:hypothetical protein
MDDRHRLTEEFMLAEENPKAELAHLRKQQRNAPEERAQYKRRAKRIRQIETRETGAATQRRGWNKQSETDTPQNEARQPYRSREQDPPNAFNDSLKSAPSKQQSNPEDCE